MEELPEGVTENDLTFQKLLVSAFLDKFQKGEADDAVWEAVADATMEVAEVPLSSVDELLKFGELVAGLLMATYSDPFEVLSNLRTFSGNTND